MFGDVWLPRHVQTRSISRRQVYRRHSTDRVTDGGPKGRLRGLYSPCDSPGKPGLATHKVGFFFIAMSFGIRFCCDAAALIAGILGPGRPILIAGRLQVRLLGRQTRMRKCHLMMMVVVMMIMVVMLMTRRRRRIGIHSDGDVHDIDLRRRYDDGGRRLRRRLHLFRATDRVATSFAAPSRPADLTFPNRCAAVASRRGCRCRDTRLDNLVPVGFADWRAR